MVTKIWLKITNVRMNGAVVQIQVEGEAGDEKNGTWLKCSQKKPAPGKLYEMVLKALQDGRKTSGKLVSKDGKSRELEISEVRTQFQ